MGVGRPEDFVNLGNRFPPHDQLVRARLPPVLSALDTIPAVRSPAVARDYLPTERSKFPWLRIRVVLWLDPPSAQPTFRSSDRKKRSSDTLQYFHRVAGYPYMSTCR